MTLNQRLEATLRQYVLGDLEEPQRLEVEKRLVTEPETFDALGVIEQELTEEYLDAMLSSVERTQFEHHYLTTPDRRRNLEFIRQLQKHATSVPATPLHRDPIGSLARIGEFFRLQPAWAVSAVGLMISGAAALWLVGGRLTSDVPTETVRPAAPVVAPRPATAPDAGRTPDPALIPPPTAPAASSNPEPATFSLTPGLLRDQGSLRRVDVPAGARAVRLRLELQTSAEQLYRAALLDAQGGEVWAQAELPAEPSAVTVVVPARVLTRGDYQITLSRTASGGQQEPLATYNFRVRTP
jgi:hypothetical protein